MKAGKTIPGTVTRGLTNQSAYYDNPRKNQKRLLPDTPTSAAFPDRFGLAVRKQESEKCNQLIKHHVQNFPQESVKHPQDH